MPKSKTFEEQHPTIHRFVEEIARIEIGWNEMIPSFLCAYDEGSMVCEGKPSHPDIEAPASSLLGEAGASIPERIESPQITQTSPASRRVSGTFTPGSVGTVPCLLW